MRDLFIFYYLTPLENTHNLDQAVLDIALLSRRRQLLRRVATLRSSTGRVAKHIIIQQHFHSPEFLSMEYLCMEFKLCF